MHPRAMDPLAAQTAKAVSLSISHPLQMDGFRRLNEGQKVEFLIEQGAKGLQAASITVIS